MAALQSIRNRGGLLVSIVIGLALVAFIVGDALSSGASVFNNQRNQVGEVGGKGISIMEFQKQLAQNEEMAKSMTGTGALTEEQQNMVRENTWQQIVMKDLMGQEYEELGINVSNEELYDILLGENMSPAVRQLFADPNTGAVDLNRAREIIRSLIEAPDGTPQKAYWLNMEKEIADSRLMSKYNVLLSKGLFITDEQAKENAENQASRSDISYIVKNYSTIDDSTIKVTPAEIKEYYSKNGKRFEQPESRNIVYVNFDVAPSSDDYTETEKTVSEMIGEFGETKEVIEFANLSSDKKADASYYKKEEIGNDSLAAFLFGNRSSVYGPYLENNAYKITRTGQTRMLSDSVKARHILIAPENNDYQKAQAIADSLANLLKKGADFGEMAKTHSKDQNSAINGGDLGWFGPKTMVQPFSDSAFFAKKNDIKVVLTQFGAHIIQVTDMAKPVEKIQVVTIEKEVLPSAKTTNKIYNDARAFATGINTLEEFDKKIGEAGLTKRMATVDKNERNISGLDNSREMIRQIYMAKEPGKAVQTTDGSTIFENGNKFTVAVLTEINEEGIAPLNSASSNIKRILIQKKKAEMLKKDLESARSGSSSLLSVAQKAGLDVKEATEVTFNSFQLPGAGIEPNVVAAASLLEQGKISEPIEGNQGVFVIMVNNRTQEPVTPEMIGEAKARLLANMYGVSYQALQAVIKNGEVKDQRYKFY